MNAVSSVFHLSGDSKNYRWSSRPKARATTIHFSLSLFRLPLSVSIKLLSLKLFSSRTTQLSTIASLVSMMSIELRPLSVLKVRVECWSLPLTKFVAFSRSMTGFLDRR
ncbi:hypothetical protein Zmor_001351 [Zophobas morio]|uniref:Uncharacterized protein n=1 Tax=Zophobas morio TaxID=2755281 RepID=A0AA38MRW4_9CUCU|nr:hypothetical protein Zmor_001351 [Zophobas morio]